MTVHELSPSGVPIALRESEIATTCTDESRKNESATDERLRAIVDRHYDFLWRTLQYLGIPSANAEDAVQQVLCVVARRLDDIAPGAEMSFLFSTAMRVASEARRAARRHPVAVCDVDRLAASAPSPEQLVDEQRARAVLRQVLEAIPLDLRVVFVLFEVEELTVAQVAALVGIPIGTASSRLRRARERFQSIVRRLRAAQEHGERKGGQ